MMADSIDQDAVAPDTQTGGVEIERIETAPARPAPVLPWHVRFGLSWSTGAVPVVLILLLGTVLGPGGLAVLTPAVLGVLDPVLPVAVAALGILAGLEFTRPAAPNRWSLLRKASLESLLTGILVTAGIWLVMPAPPGDRGKRGRRPEPAPGAESGTGSGPPGPPLGTGRTGRG